MWGLWGLGFGGSVEGSLKRDLWGFLGLGYGVSFRSLLP